MEICQENPNLVKIWQKYRTLQMKIWSHFIVAGDKIAIKAEDVHWASAPLCYAIRTLPILI